jgi:hypothetical protein
MRQIMQRKTIRVEFEVDGETHSLTGELVLKEGNSITVKIKDGSIMDIPMIYIKSWEIMR